MLKLKLKFQLKRKDINSMILGYLKLSNFMKPLW